MPYRQDITAAERNYTTIEREEFAVMWAVTKFCSYTEGLPVTVIVSTFSYTSEITYPNNTAQ